MQRLAHKTPSWLFIALILMIRLPAPEAGAAQDADAPEAADARSRLADTQNVERETLQRMLIDESWARRAVAAVRLERYGCEESRKLLVNLLKDPKWQVRSYAIRSLGRRREHADAVWFADEQNPRVLRTALRYRYSIDSDRLARGVKQLARSNDMEDRLLAAEIGAAGGTEELKKIARESLKKVILRMKRSETGAFSPRVATLTGQRDLRRAYRWKEWHLKHGRSYIMRSGHYIDEGTEPLEPALIARLDPERFAALEDYVEELGSRKVDLAICLDCTASMSGELSAAQAGIDDLMLFVGNVVSSLRIGIVAYRDRGDEFETKGWDFTSDIGTARSRLWQLSADGGGDSREAVHPAMKFAFTQLSWKAEHTKVLIVIGDAPPHVGWGAPCIEMAKRAAENELTTHTIQCEGEDVEHFPEIAEAGEGKCVSLEDDDLLIAEIAGLTLGDTFEREFREFFEMYLSLCR